MAFVTLNPLVPRTNTVSRRCARRAPVAVLDERSAAATSTKPMTSYEYLTAMTTIVEDTGDIETIRALSPFAATTNPSLVYAAADMPEYAPLIDEAVKFAKSLPSDTRLSTARNKLFTLFGAQILDAVHPSGDVSTEVDARLSFDTEAQIETAHEIIKMYEDVGVARERVLIKLATTWEGIEACRALERDGIRTNMTLLFSLAQAAAAADAGAYLISPFVGRILDYYKKATGKDGYPADEDPGVISVKQIYDYYKCYGYDTIVMGASFRNLEEILALAGCDRLTIAPKYIAALQQSTDVVERKLAPPGMDSERCDLVKMNLDEKEFRWMLNEDPMATEKLAEGIRKFAVDLVKLDAKLEKMLL